MVHWFSSVHHVHPRLNKAIVRTDQIMLTKRLTRSYYSRKAVWQDAKIAQSKYYSKIITRLRYARPLLQRLPRRWSQPLKFSNCSMVRPWNNFHPHHSTSKIYYRRILLFFWKKLFIIMSVDTYVHTYIWFLWKQNFAAVNSTIGRFWKLFPMQRC